MDLVSEAKQFISRAKSGSVKRMLLLARQAHEESGKPTALVFADMASCILRYGIGYQEYISYDFVNKPEVQETIEKTKSSAKDIADKGSAAIKDFFENKDGE